MEYPIYTNGTHIMCPKCKAICEPKKEQVIGQRYPVTCQNCNTSFSYEVAPVYNVFALPKKQSGLQ